jgi:DNA polymerase V
MYALIDCNRMYASCERIYRPDLRDKPIVILSNNDGTVVTLTKEAQALGVPKFSPYFQIKELCEQKNIHVFSSNYELYGDVSASIMSIISSEVPDISVYSIDEAFGDFRNCPTIELRDKAKHIKDRLWRETRMPVCVGMGKSKTLAKLANHIAKKMPKSNGVCCLDNDAQISKWLKKFSVNEVWGIGKQISKKLNNMNIFTAYDLANANLKHIRSQLSVNVERTARELMGEACLTFHDTVPNKKQIVVSRSFSKKVTDKNELLEATANYAAKAAEKLRKQNGMVQAMVVCAHSSIHQPNYVYHQKLIAFPAPTSDTNLIISSCTNAVNELFRPGVKYSKAIVMFVDIVQKDSFQLDMLSPGDSKKSIELMKLIDKLNINNQNNISIGRQGIKKEWSMKRQLMSPCYTTKWDDLPKIG